jgi:hypothetical protein
VGLPVLWWQQVPAAVSRVTPGFGNALTDGIHLVRWPPVAAAAPPIAAAAGAVLAGLHREQSFTASVLLVSLLAAIGLTSVQLGAWAWLGYTLVEVATNGQRLSSFAVRGTEAWLRLQGATVAHAVLLGMLVVGVPMVVLATRLEVRGFGWLRRAGPSGEAVAAVIATGVALYLWTQATVLLVRPVFTLQRAQPTVAAVAPVQVQWPLVVGVGIGVVGLRLYTERRALAPRVEAAVAAASTRLAAAAGVWRLPGVVSAALSAAVGTLLLASVVSGLSEAALTFVVLFALSVLRDYLRAAGWLRIVGAVPTIVRLVLALGACVVITRFALGTIARGSGGWSSDSFFVPWLAVLASALVVVVLTAPTRAGRQIAPAASPAPAREGSVA